MWTIPLKGNITKQLSMLEHVSGQKKENLKQPLWRNVYTNVIKNVYFFSLATRESAFVHAIASSGVAFAVTRSCAEGTSTMCGCDSHHKGPPGEGWKWGGCSEDAEFGVLVSREFADARENRPDARSAMNRHNNEAGRMVRDSWSWFQK